MVREFWEICVIDEKKEKVEDLLPEDYQLFLQKEREKRKRDKMGRKKKKKKKQ